MATWVARQMRTQPRFRNLRTAEIHGDRTQAQREEALQAFREGNVQVLVATDVAARGLDIAGVAHVVNFDLASTPDEFDSYVHRIGRTGRAGNTGIATSFYVPGFDAKSGCGRVAGSLLHLLKETNQTIPDWFLQLPEVRNLSTSGEGGGRHEPKFGGRDMRNLNSRGKSHAQSHQSQRFTSGFGHGNEHSQEYKSPFQPPQNVGQDGQQQQQQQQQQQYPTQQRFSARGGPQRFSNYGNGRERPQRQDFRGGFQDPLPPQQRGGLLPDPMHGRDSRGYGSQQYQSQPQQHQQQSQQHQQQQHQQQSHQQQQQQQQHQQQQSQQHQQQPPQQHQQLQQHQQQSQQHQQQSQQHSPMQKRRPSGPRFREFQPGQMWRSSESESASHSSGHNQPDQQWDGAASSNQFQKSDQARQDQPRQQPRHVVVTQQELQQQVQQSFQTQQAPQSFRPLQSQSQRTVAQQQGNGHSQQLQHGRRNAPPLLTSQGAPSQQPARLQDKKTEGALQPPSQKDRRSFPQSANRVQQPDTREGQLVASPTPAISQQSAQQIRSPQVPQQPVQQTSEKLQNTPQERTLPQAKSSPDKQTQHRSQRQQKPKTSQPLKSVVATQPKTEIPVNA